MSTDMFPQGFIDHVVRVEGDGAPGPRSLFTAQDYDRLAAIVFRPTYPGNATARGVVEAPNGDPAARDTQKVYAHVACKYLDQMAPDDPDRATLAFYLRLAYACAMAHAVTIGVPDAFLPEFEFGALRVLRYPAGAGSHTHTDFDLLTLNCYRSHPELLVPGGERYHYGELCELIGFLGGGGTLATPHRVDPHPTEEQRSVVYFGMPDHSAVLPDGRTVAAWLQERLARSRYRAA